MNLEEVFPRASIEEKEYTIEKIERLLGDNNEVLLNYDNGDYLDDIEHIYLYIRYGHLRELFQGVKRRLKRHADK